MDEFLPMSINEWDGELMDLDEAEVRFQEEIKKQIKTAKWRLDDFIAEYELQDPDEVYFDISFSGIILNVVYRVEGHHLVGRFSEDGFEEGRYNHTSVGTETEMKRIIEVIKNVE